MLATTHVLVGAMTGEVIPNPYFSFTLSAYIHFVIDKIPHFWPLKRQDKVILVLFDWVIAFLIIVLLAISPIDNKLPVLAGALGGIIVDIVLVGLPGMREHPIGIWHSQRQPHQKRAIYLVTDLIFIIPLIIYFWSQG